MAKNGISNPFLTKTEAIDALEEKILSNIPAIIIRRSSWSIFVRRNDSSTVVALMQAQSKKAINTFSIGFNEKLA